jgi:glycosyltransferase involved in cell wall biosynthesis
MGRFFSVIIPTLNEELFIPRVLEKLKNQKTRNFEVIVVDAASKDQTRKKARSFKSSLPLKIFQVNKKNVSFQRNFGAKKAHGKYLIFLDADCWVNSNFTARLEKYIKTKKGLVFLPYVDPEGNATQMKTFFKLLNFLIDVSQGLKKPMSSVGCMIWDRDLFLRIGGYDEKIFVYEDQNIVKKAADWGIRAKFMPHIKVKFSLRRIKKEGNLKSLYKLIAGTSHIIFKGDIRKKIYDYEMGGHLYKGSKVKG